MKASSTFNKAVLLGVAGFVALLVINAGLSYRNTRQLSEDADWVAHTQEAIGRISGVQRKLVDAETAYRGFVVTGKEEFLEPYDHALATLPDHLQRLKSLTNDNAAQQERVTKLEDLSAACLANMKADIQLRRDQGFDVAQVRMAGGDGKRRMDAIRQLVDEMTGAEEQLLKDRERHTRMAYNVAVATGWTVAGLGLLLVVGFVWLLERSLSARHKAAAAIHAQQQWFRTTLASIGDAVIATDPHGRVSFLNRVAQELTGWTQPDALGKPLVAVFNIVNEQTRAPVDNPVGKVLELGQVVGLANHTVLIGKDGGERAIDDSAAPIRDDKGRVIGVVLVFHDVTERRQAEDGLRESAQRLRFVMDSMPQKIFTAAPNGDVDYLNPIWMQFTGLPFEQIRDWGWTQFIHADDVVENVRRWRQSLDTGAPFQFEHRFRRHDGAYRWHLSRALPMRAEAGRIVMWIGSNTDIHEQKKAAERLRELTASLSEADRRKDEFLATLAHELRNPLAPIRNGLQIMRLANCNGAVFEQARTMMERQLAQMVHLVDDLLDVSRISRGKLELRKQRVDLAVVLNNAVETSRPLIESNGHKLSVRLPPQAVLVDADLTRLAQVFANLLNNAAKYSERGGQIALTAERQGSDVVVTVKDTGVGIPPDMVPKIFEMFTQVDRSLERSQGGLGIGLTLVKRLVEMHGGSVEARSEGHGSGSEFIVRLPAISSEVHELQPPAPEVEPARPSAPCRVLVADDNEDSATSLSMMLQIMGHEVRTANDGLLAVETAAAFRPDVILLDIGMPKLNGYEACRRIRAQPWGTTVMLVALTGWGQDEDRQRSAEAGFNHHLVKPVDPADLEKLLASMKTPTA